MAGKSNIRSIRFTDELYELIDRQTGDTFTQKLENLVTQCVWELPQKEKELKQIQGQIAKERSDLRQLRDAKAKLERNIREINRSLENLQWQVNRAAKELEGPEA